MTNRYYCPHLTELDGDCTVTGRTCKDTREDAACKLGLLAFTRATVVPYHPSRMRKAGYPRGE